MFVPTVVVVVSLWLQRSTVGLSAPPFCRRSSACSDGNSSSLPSLTSVVGGSCCTQSRHAAAIQHWEVCAATYVPVVPMEVTSPDCPSVCQSECVGYSVVTGGQRAWRGENPSNDDYSEIVCSFLYCKAVVGVHSRTLHCSPLTCLSTDSTDTYYALPTTY